MAANAQYLIGVAFETMEKGAKDFRVSINGVMIMGRVVDKNNRLVVTWPRKTKDES